MRQRNPSRGETPMYRVKLYRLNCQGHWDDRGTGHVAVEYLPKPQAMGLVVVGEHNCNILLVHKMCSPDAYQLQGENTIITWLDADVGTDVALSFQEESGCSAIWDAIHSNHEASQQDVDEPIGAGGPFAESQADPASPLPAAAASHPTATPGDPTPTRGSPGGGLAVNGVHSAAGHVAKLPWPDPSTLTELARTLADVLPSQREHVAASIYTDGSYLPRLLEVFRESEHRGDATALCELYSIVRSLIMMNDLQLLDEMLAERNFWDVVGCLEYDPELAPRKGDFRSYLKNSVTFRELVPMPSGAIRDKVHATFRIGYLRDAVLPRTLDDATFTALHSMMMFNYMEIMQSLHSSPEYFSELFKKLQEADYEREESVHLMQFLQEVCHLTTHPHFQSRPELLRIFFRDDVLAVLAHALASSLATVRTHALEVLLTLIQADVALIRTRMLQPPHDLLRGLVAQLLSSDASGLPEQALELLRGLLDPDTMEAALQDKNAFLDLFYDSFMERIVTAVDVAGRALAVAGAQRPPCQVGAEGRATAQSGVAAAPGSARGEGAAEAAAGLAAGAATEGSARVPEPEGGARPVDVGVGGGAQADGSAMGRPKGDTRAGSSAAAAATGGPVERHPADDGGALADAGQAADAAGALAAPLHPATGVLPPFVLALVLDLLQYCVSNHSFRIKYWILRRDILQKALVLLHSPKRWLAAAALRLLRTCVGLQDDFFNRYLVRHDLLGPPLAIWLANGGRPNLFDSTFLELLEFIRVHSIRPLISAFVERHWPAVSAIQDVAVFWQLKEKYDQMREPALAPPGDRSALGSEGQPSRRRGPRDLDAAEERYFSEAGDDDVDDGGAGAGAVGNGEGFAGGARPLDGGGGGSREALPGARDAGRRGMRGSADADAATPTSLPGGGPAKQTGAERPHLAAAFTGRRSPTSSRGEWPRSGPMSAFAGLGDDEDSNGNGGGAPALGALGSDKGDSERGLTSVPSLFERDRGLSATPSPRSAMSASPAAGGALPARMSTSGVRSSATRAGSVLLPPHLKSIMFSAARSSGSSRGPEGAPTSSCPDGARAGPAVVDDVAEVADVALGERQDITGLAHAGPSGSGGGGLQTDELSAPSPDDTRRPLDGDGAAETSGGHKRASEDDVVQMSPSKVSKVDLRDSREPRSVS